MATRRFVGAGGGVYDIDVPLSEVYQYQFDKGFLRLVPGEKPFDDDLVEPQAEVDDSSRPTQASPKAEWVAYAESVSDMSHDDIASMTKAQLVERFG